MILFAIVLACFTMAGIYHMVGYLHDVGDKRRNERM